MNVIEILNKKLLEQSFEDELDQHQFLMGYQQVARLYSMMENAIAVLSDLKLRKSYVYHGGVALQLGLAEKGQKEEIDSIWEENIFKRIHPDDLLEKHLLELRFFHFMKELPISERLNYYLSGRIRMHDESGKYLIMRHRMFYACSHHSMRLALCLYDFSPDRIPLDAYDGTIMNSATGYVIKPDKQQYDHLLSAREKEILGLIAKGKTSQDMANLLYISVHTVNRHRQNILEKLRVKNSMEACRIADLMGLL